MNARAPFSLLPTPRAGGAELSAVERQLIEDFRQMGASSQATFAGAFRKSALREREQRIAASKSKFQVLQGGA